MSQVIAITGPAGSGKTNVSEQLTKQLKSFVNIDVDHLKHMNPNAFTKVIDEDGEEDWPYSAWELLGENIALLAKNFLNHGNDVIINGYLEVESWQEIEKNISIDYKFLLLPKLEVNIQRDDNRTEEIKMGSKAIKKHQELFRKTEFYDDFIKINTSEDSIEQTIQKITDIIS
jgi:adenylate kinase family enzyme